MMQTIRYSTVSNFRDNRPIMREAADWSEFVLALASMREAVPADARAKAGATPCLSPALYSAGAARRDADVVGWGAWCALDVDNAGPFTVTAGEAASRLKSEGLPYVIYGTTKATADRHAFRVVLPLSGELARDEARGAHAAIVQRFEALEPDPACKDLSRIYAGPMVWTPARPGEVGNLEPIDIFAFALEGAPLDLAATLAAYVQPPVVAPPPAVAASIPGRASAAIVRPSRLKALPAGSHLLDSPVVSSEAVDRYLTLPPGHHHRGLFSFLLSVIARGQARGYAVEPHDLEGYARALDAMSPIKTARERWGRLNQEIDLAMRWADSQTASP